MLKFMLSVRLPERLLPRIGVEESCSPALAPPNGTVLVNALNAPPLFEIWKSADGMLLPAPSVNADVERLWRLFRQSRRPKTVLR